MNLQLTGEELAIKEGLERFFLVILVALSVATLSRTVSWLRQIPYTLLLVIVGLGLGIANLPLVKFSPTLILEIFLPPLLFEAAWNASIDGLKKRWLPIFLFAVLGVIISIVGVAFPLSYFSDLPLSITLLVGASLAPTDPVAVVALFRELGTSKDLTSIVEGESLFNDGVAVVAFSLLLGIPFTAEVVSVESSLTTFLVFIGVAVAVGLLIGFSLSYLIQRFEILLVEQSLTLVAAYATYFIAEEFHGSGVIGVVIVGLILGNYGSRVGMSPRNRLVVTEFWEFLAFLVNSIVFLLIGSQINITDLFENLDLILLAIIAIVLSRLVAVFGLAFLGNILSKKRIGIRNLTVIWWGGLRGAVSIALALSIPTIVSQRSEILDIVFGVVLFTLLIQGLTMKWLIEKLGLIGDQPLFQEFSELSAKKIALGRVLEHLNTLEPTTVLKTTDYLEQEQLVLAQIKTCDEQLGKMSEQFPKLREISLEELKETLLDIEADTYAEFIRSGRLDKHLSPVLEDVLYQAQDEEIGH